MKDYVKEFDDIIEDESHADCEIIHEAQRIIREMQFNLSMKKFTLTDTDDKEVYGVLSVIDKTPLQVQYEINRIKTELEDEWTIEDVISRLPKDWNVMFESLENGDGYYGTIRI